MLAIICSLLITLVNLCGVQSHSCHSRITQSVGSDAPTINICSLLSKPADYDGKEIRVHTTYHFGFEYSYFDDSACKEYAVETTPYWTGNVVWAAFQHPSVEASTEPAVYKEFKNMTEGCCLPSQDDSQAELIVVGKFFKASDKGYGHSGRYALQLVVSKIEKLSKIKPAEHSDKKTH